MRCFSVERYLPSKSGAAELRELGFAETGHTATDYQKENYFTFLTAEGQAFAVKHLADTRFSVPTGGYIGCPITWHTAGTAC